MKKVIASTFVLISALGLSACQELEKINEALAKPVTTQPKAINNTPALASRLDDKDTIKTELITPKDSKVKQAIDEALPTIKKVIGVHSCIRSDESMRLLNQYALPGHDMSSATYYWVYPMRGMKYHNSTNCLGIRTIDQFSLAALNALQLRSVYFADDSGETRSIGYTFVRIGEGKWQLSQINLAN